jgi:hypothetical protein
MKRISKPLVLAALGALLSAAPAASAGVPDAAAVRSLQFASGGHLVSFAPGDLRVVAGSHALRVEFVGARAVAPVAPAAAVPAGKVAPLTRVAYPELWRGITLAYDAAAGLLRSTYTLAPGADPAQIRLRYNAPVKVGPDGCLRIAFAAGTMQESAPVAWQDIAGRRVPVTVAFRAASEREVGFVVGSYDTACPLIIDPTLSWNTFLGGADYDTSLSVAIDAGGNTYVAGKSSATWGAPILPHAAAPGNSNGFVAKLDPNGVLLWSTFLGPADESSAEGVGVDGSGNVFVAGWSVDTWGTPVRDHAGPAGTTDAFMAKLDANGVLLWNTFVGGGDFPDCGYAMVVDASGNAYMTGNSDISWGAPTRAFAASGVVDAFVAKFDASGALVWNTFLGGADSDAGSAIALGPGNTVFVAGQSFGTWGIPVDAFAGTSDAFVAQLSSSGGLVWNTFLGGADNHAGHGIAVDASGNSFIVGTSDGPWGGAPIRGFAGATDGFAAKLDSSGGLIWNTFFGTVDGEEGHGIALDASANVYLTGWTALGDAFVAKLDGSGAQAWGLPLGGWPESDRGYAIAVDAGGNAFVSGVSEGTWGEPIRGNVGSGDAFVIRLGNIATDAVRPTGSIRINNGDATTATTAVTLNLLAADTGGSGMGSMRFRNGDTGLYSAWEPYQTVKSWTLLSGAGSKKVTVQFRDRAGNISDSNALASGNQAYWDWIKLVTP